MAADRATTALRPRVGRTVPLAHRLLGAVALVPVVAYVVVAVLRVGYPYELTYFEGSTVEVMARVVAGEPLYAAPTDEWAPWPYPPLYFWLSAGLAHLTGVSLLPMRLVSLVASLVAFALVASIVRRYSGNAVAGLVAAGLFAATYWVSGAWFDTARVDSLLVALLLAAVYGGDAGVDLAGRDRPGGGAVRGLLHQAEHADRRGADAALAGLATTCGRGLRRPDPGGDGGRLDRSR